MPKALLRFFLALLTGAALIATSAAASVSEPVCADCCAYSPVPGACASACAPAAPAAHADQQAPADPAGIAGVAALPGWLVASARPQLAIPPGMRHPPGPPAYITFARLLL